jgi:hypothetical protein
MTRRARRRRLDARSLTALVDFARGYLHQDVIAEHGSANGAAAAFCEDASDDERRRLAEDLLRLSDAARGWPAATLARFFADELGAAWTPATLSDIHALEAIVRTAGNRRGSS